MIALNSRWTEFSTHQRIFETGFDWNNIDSNNLSWLTSITDHILVAHLVFSTLRLNCSIDYLRSNHRSINGCVLTSTAQNHLIMIQYMSNVRELFFFYRRVWLWCEDSSISMAVSLQIDRKQVNFLIWKESFVAVKHYFLNNCNLLRYTGGNMYSLFTNIHLMCLVRIHRYPYWASWLAYITCVMFNGCTVTRIWISCPSMEGD